MEHIEYISENLRLFVSDEHTFGTDALLLASFASPRKNDRCCDLGTGCGIIPVYWIREGLCAPVYGVDIQEKAIDQLTRSAEINGLTGRLLPVLSDLRELHGKIPFGELDLVTMNPPYKAVGTGIISRSASDKIARHETECGLSEICTAAAKLLRFGGRFCVCIKPERLYETMHEMSKAKIEPKRLRLVSQRDGKTPWLCLIEGRRGGKTGLTVEAELHIESEEMNKIIGSYKK